MEDAWMCSLVHYISLECEYPTALAKRFESGFTDDGGMSRENRTRLAEKFERSVPAKAALFNPVYDDRLQDVLAELSGYIDLRSIAQHEPQFIAESNLANQKSPDLLVSSARPMVMECKNIRNSTAQTEYFANHQGQVRAVNTALLSPTRDCNPLLDKLLKTADDANSQFLDYPREAYDRIVYLNYVLDLEVLILRAANPNLLDGLLAEVAAVLEAKGTALVVCDRYGVESPYRWVKGPSGRGPER
ncbi:MAG: hypothetical protein KGK07_14945 [Chloroflexota bacterium]|nr:hypothetical protein [Chloroflexota bacterium]